MSMCSLDGAGFAPRKNPNLPNNQKSPLEVLQQKAEMRRVIREEKMYQELLAKEKNGEELTPREKMQLNYLKAIIAAEQASKIADSAVCYVA